MYSITGSIGFRRMNSANRVIILFTGQKYPFLKNYFYDYGHIFFNFIKIKFAVVEFCFS